MALASHPEGGKRRRPQLGRVPALLLVLLLALPEAAPALLGGHVHGHLDLGAVQSETGGQERRTLRRDLRLVGSRALLPYLTLRASYRDYRFDLDREELASYWQRETLPQAQLAWRHPLFHFSALASRRDSRSLLALSDLSAETLRLSLRTRDPRYPLASLTFDHLRTRETGAGEPRDTRDRRLQVELSYRHGGSSLSYAHTRRYSENLLPGLESEERDHALRWNSSRSDLADGLLILDTSYLFNRAEREDRSLEAGAVLEAVPPLAGLYAEDASPEFGALEPVAGLIDGDRASPVDPPVDIGGEGEYRNLGADLGFARPLGAVYVYTDRASGSGQSWNVYVSEDNQAWAPSDSGLAVVSNPSLDRFEIRFDTVEARYVKVVNRGFNEVGEVLVTEIEVYERLEQDERCVTRDRQLASLRLGLHPGGPLSLEAELSYQDDPGSGLVDRRLSSAVALGARLEQGEDLIHSLRWERSLQDFQGEGEDIRDDAAGYALRADPLETLDATLTLSLRRSYLREVLDQELSSAGLQLQGRPGWGLDLGLGLTGSRNRFPREERDYRNWTWRGSLSGDLTSRLGFGLDYLLQDTRDLRERRRYYRHVLGAEYRLQLSMALSQSGRFHLVDDRHRTLSQRYTLSWNPTSNWSLSGVADLSDSETGLETRRYSLGLNYDMNRSSTLYVRAAVTDLRGAGGGRTNSLQQGLRARF